MYIALVSDVLRLFHFEGDMKLWIMARNVFWFFCDAAWLTALLLLGIPCIILGMLGVGGAIAFIMALFYGAFPLTYWMFVTVFLYAVVCRELHARPLRLGVLPFLLTAGRICMVRATHIAYALRSLVS